MKQRMLVLGLMVLFMAPFFMSGVASADGERFSEGLTIQHSFENGSIVIETFYRTDYVNGKWRITDNKNVDISLRVFEQPENTTILVEHMHADCVIFSNDSQKVNGLSQDSMDDSFHGDQGGFYVSLEYQYNCVFAIEGYSQYLMNIWGFICGEYGYIRGADKRLTESNLIEYGAQGSEFMTVFDILIKNDNETFYHTISFMDDFVVYFDGTFDNNFAGILEPPYVEPESINIIFIGACILFGIMLCGAFLYMLSRN